MKVIFEKSRSGRKASAQFPNAAAKANIAAKHLRHKTPILPEVSELDVVRHYTNLSQQNFSVDTHFYPLGSCTMKYNPRIIHTLASMPEFLSHHPYSLAEQSQGFLQIAYELQKMLSEVVGMPGVSLAPMAGAQGEFAGVAMIRAYHIANGEGETRTEIIVPDAAHGTNPASAAMSGYQVKEIPTKADGDVDIEALKAAVGPQTAGIMLTNPSTLGVFERKIQEIADIIHDVGGMLYYDGANLNAILGTARPGDMGFDVLHLNLHKTFGCPHGGGGPGCGPVAACKKLQPFLPVPMVGYQNDQYVIETEDKWSQSIGRMSAFMGNAGIMIRAYVYIKILGAQGLKRVGDFATLNSNYLMKRLEQEGFTVPFGQRRASHEFIVSLKDQKEQLHVTAMDVAKRLLDYNFHAPTTYFPLLVPECLLIEPTETESKQEMDDFVAGMVKMLKEAKENPEVLQHAPNNRPLGRLDNVKAAKELNLKWEQVDS